LDPFRRPSLIDEQARRGMAQAVRREVPLRPAAAVQDRLAIEVVLRPVEAKPGLQATSKAQTGGLILSRCSI
jgi:hypothetical protein